MLAKLIVLAWVSLPFIALSYFFKVQFDEQEKDHARRRRDLVKRRKALREREKNLRANKK